MSIQERIAVALENQGITPYRFCKDLGFAMGYLSKSGAIGTDKYLKIIKYLPNISSDWLLTGEGNMLKNSNTEIPVSDTLTLQDTEQKKGLPLIPIEAAAGYPNIADNDGVSLEEMQVYYVPEFVNRGANFVIRVSGNSMYPMYSSGDVLACRRIESMRFFQWGKVYVIDSSQGALVKRIYECPNDENCIICHSENTKEFPDFKLPKDEIRSLSLVVGAIKSE